MSKCKSCIHINEVPKLAGGGFECRFMPPTVFMFQQNGGMAFISKFPNVNSDMSCGMYDADIDLEIDPEIDPDELSNTTGGETDNDLVRPRDH